MADPDKHAYLSASGASRWTACSGAPALEAQAPDDRTDYSDGGTAAHELASTALTTHRTAAEARDGLIQHHGATRADYPDDMVAFVQEYVDYCNALPGSQTYVEKRVSFDQWVPGGFGTADHTKIDGEVAYVTDLKYGLGVPVNAVWNPQLMIYALGVLQDIDLFGEVQHLVLTIHQPRLESVTTFEIDRDELVAWAEDELAPAAARAMAPDAPRIPGTKQCQFCKARAICPELFTAANADPESYLPGVDPRAPSESVVRSKIDAMTPDQVAQALDRVDLVAMWVSGIRKYGRARLTADAAAIPGWRLDPGNRQRAWDDEDAVRLKLKRALGSAVAAPPKLISVAQAEKLLPAGHKILAQHVTVKRGEPRLVRSDTTEIDPDEFDGVDEVPGDGSGLTFDDSPDPQSDSVPVDSGPDADDFLSI